MKHLLSSLALVLALAACGRSDNSNNAAFRAADIACSGSFVFHALAGGDGLTHQVTYTFHSYTSVSAGSAECGSDITVGCNYSSPRTFFFVSGLNTGESYAFDVNSCHTVE